MHDIQLFTLQTWQWIRRHLICLLGLGTSRAAHVSSSLMVVVDRLEHEGRRSGNSGSVDEGLLFGGPRGSMMGRREGVMVKVRCASSDLKGGGTSDKCPATMKNEREGKGPAGKGYVMGSYFLGSRVGDNMVDSPNKPRFFPKLPDGSILGSLQEARLVSEHTGWWGRNEFQPHSYRRPNHLIYLFICILARDKARTFY